MNGRQDATDRGAANRDTDKLGCDRLLAFLDVLLGGATLQWPG